MEHSDGWLAAAIIFSVLDLLLIAAICIFPCFTLWILAQVGSGGFGSGQSHEEELEEKMKYRIYLFVTCCVILPGLIVSNVIMWMLYDGIVEFENNEVIFWIVTIVPFVVGTILCILSLFKCTNV